jgi:iron-sulfur cluster insertion protein
VRPTNGDAVVVISTISGPSSAVHTFFTCAALFLGPIRIVWQGLGLDMITVTVRAAEKVKEIAAGESLEGRALRMRVVGGGCAGFTYDLYFEDKEPSDMDEVFEDKGVKLIVDPLSLQYLDGTEVDYVDSNMGAGFKFLNPNTKGSCGCGSSFSA